MASAWPTPTDGDSRAPSCSKTQSDRIFSSSVRCEEDCVSFGVPRLEDPDAEEVKEFVERQAALTDSVLARCEERERLRRQITALFDHPRYSTPFKRGGKYFYYHNTGLQAQSVIYVQKDLDGEAEVLLDPNILSEDGTVALSMASVSKDGRYLAYGLSKSGSDWVTIKVMRIDDKTPESDTISWVKFSSVSWTLDGKGFFYGRYPPPEEGVELDAGTETKINLNHELYYHFLGTHQSEDILCWRDPEYPKYIFGVSVTNDGKFALLHITEGCDPVNKLYYCDLCSLPNGLEGFRGSNEMLPFVKLVDNFEARYSAVANDDSEFTFLTNKGAPRCKLVRVDLKEPDLWTDILPEHERDVLESAYAVNGNQILVCYLRDVKHILQIRDMSTGDLLHCLPLDVGSVSGISARRENSEIFISFTSFLSPGIIYRCNLATEVQEMKIFREISIPGYDRTEFDVKQRPDLFGCVLAHVGVMDMLRFHKFTIGHAWTSDYGCSDNEEEFHWLIKYSPLHNIKRPWEKGSGQSCQYPPTMLLTADHDDRVVPLHSLKLLATMQYILCNGVENSPQTNPIIARIDRKAGHGAGRPTQKLIDEAADRYSFMAKVLGVSWID
ncbi:uncharacterized protein LOC135584265 isoform X3 [Musa acuminata AAA Group]|uniref:uncharacterized protein LOC135584265 isoform X3 n=1 Tax=Musa acuminata AAA Group TaxID=214697 RepID=UPI0031D5B191